MPNTVGFQPHLPYMLASVMLAPTWVPRWTKPPVSLPVPSSNQCPLRAGPALLPTVASAPGTVPTSVYSQEPVPRGDELAPVLSALGFCPFSAGGLLGNERSFLYLPPSLHCSDEACYYSVHPPAVLQPAFFSIPKDLPDSPTKCLLILQGLFHVPDPPGSSPAHPPHTRHSTLLFPKPSAAD